MLIELYIFAFVIIAYGAFTTLALFGFGKLNISVKEMPDDQSPFISIIISARNEARTIKLCIEQIIKQKFPKDKFELIIVDDASEDHTYDIAQQTLVNSGISYRLIKQQIHAGKKQNMAAAIHVATGKIIVTSDADVNYRHVNWLSTISRYFRQHAPNMLIMPVDYERNNVLHQFQFIENLALTAVTAGYTGINKPFMCNGANLAFTKEAFETVSGYDSHLNLSSGEDVLLLEDLKKIDSRAIHYCLMRELIVKTEAADSLAALFNQRVRWAYKAKFNPNGLNLFAGFIILAANLLILALFAAILKKSVIIPYLSIFVLAKFVFDFLLLFLASNFLGRKNYLAWFLPFQCVYWLYALCVGTASLFFKPLWKGKKIQ